jgi:hypothetical protein
MAVAGFAPCRGVRSPCGRQLFRIMPEGVLDSGFRRLFVGVRVTNGSAQAWPATEVHISPRGRRILAAAGIAVSDGYPAATRLRSRRQPRASGSCRRARARRFQTVFFKMDVSSATPRRHTLELSYAFPRRHPRRSRRPLHYWWRERSARVPSARSPRRAIRERSRQQSPPCPWIKRSFGGF